MTVQEFIYALNKVEDKSKLVRLCGIELVEELIENTNSVDIY